jgi:hypothetical protein
MEIESGGKWGIGEPNLCYETGNVAGQIMLLHRQ